MASESFTRLSTLTQTTYARLVDVLVTTDAGFETGTPVSKQIRGHRYWYIQRIVDGVKTQTYLGRETPELQAQLARWRTHKQEAESRAELVAMARAGGAHAATAAETRVLELLSALFRIGGVLVGSHAFAVLGTTLGVRWHETIVRTEDIDIAHDPHIAVALARDVDPAVLKEPFATAEPRFSILDPESPATTFKLRGTAIEVDLLTPLIGRERTKPIRLPMLGAAATPLRYLDYLIEESEPAAVVGGRGVLVNVPRPGRFALHKLVIANRRTGPRVKAHKDRLQATALLEVLLSDLPGELALAWKALAKYGRGWIKVAREGLGMLAPDLVEALRAVGVDP